MAKEFCVQNRVADRVEQYKILKLIETKIDHYRKPEEPKAATLVAKERIIDPKFKRDILEIFNDIWYDFDEENGQIGMVQYKTVMRYVQKYKRIPENNIHFSDDNLEKAFNLED